MVHWQSGIPELNGPVFKKKEKDLTAIQQTSGALENERREGFSKEMRGEVGGVE